MNEKPRYPAQLSSPEQWVGHGPTDACQRIYQPSIFDIPEKQRRESEKIRKLYYDLSKNDMDRFLKAQASVPIRTFGPMQPFNADNFEPGTIIRINEEFGYWQNGNFEVYSDSPILGVICEPKKGQGEGRKMALYFPMPKGGYNYIAFRDPVLKIGIAVHSKTNHPEKPDEDNVRKINNVEVLYPGKGKRESGRFRLPLLTPSTTQSAASIQH